MKVPSPVVPRTQVPDTQLGYLQAPVADTSGLTRGLQTFAAGIAELGRRNQQVEDLKVRKDFVDWQTGYNTGYVESKQNSDPSANNFVPATETSFEKSSQQFMNDKVPQRLRDEYNLRIAEFHQNVASDAQTFQLKQQDEYTKQVVDDNTNHYLSTLAEDPSQLAKVQTELNDQIDKTTVGEAEKIQLKRQMLERTEKIAAGAEQKNRRLEQLDPQSSYEFFNSRVTGNVSRDSILNTRSDFGARSMEIIKAAEAATGQKVVIRDMSRTKEEQAAIYYDPNRKGPAAAPGHSKHETGAAMDINDGKALDWMRTHAGEFGLSFPVANDKGHMQLDPKYMSGTYTGYASLSHSIEMAESGGRVGLVSPTGAAGVMQVEPYTARELAVELKDPNFPTGGSDQQVQAYLNSSADIGRTYGNLYLNKMLKRYNGDAEAAVIAYNGGPGKADEWLKAGRNDSVLRPETIKYRNKVLGGIPTAGHMSVLNNPAYQHVPFEDLVNITDKANQDAQQEVSAARTEAKRQNDEAVNQLQMDIYNGAGQPAIDAARAKGILNDIDDLHRVDAELKAYNERMGGIQDVQTKLQNGITLDPKNPDEMKGYNELYKRGIGDAKLEAMDGAAAQDLTQLSRMGQAIPSDAYNKLVSMTRNANGKKAEYAYNTLLGLQDVAPDHFGALADNDMISALGMWRTNFGVYNTDEMLSRLAGGRTGEERLAFQKSKEEAKHHFTDSTSTDFISKADVYSSLGLKAHFGEGITAGAPQMEQLMEIEYQGIYAQQWALYGNKDQAMNATAAIMKRSWGVTSVGEPTFMPLPPESENSGYKPMAGNYQWIDRQLRQELQLKPDQRYQLITDSVTMKEAQAKDPNNPVSYKVLAYNEAGAPVAVPGRYYFVPTEADKAFDSATREVNKAKAQLDAIDIRAGLFGGVPPQDIPEWRAAQEQLYRASDEMKKFYKDYGYKAPPEETAPLGTGPTLPALGN